MRLSEFYEKYFVIIDGATGEKVHPKLTPMEKLILDTAEDLHVPPYVITRRRMGPTSWDVHPLVQDKINASHILNSK